jgi:hypothetical protein
MKEYENSKMLEIIKKVPFYVECLEGLIGLSKGELDNIEIIATKLGGPIVE